MGKESQEFLLALVVGVLMNVEAWTHELGSVRLFTKHTPQRFSAGCGDALERAWFGAGKVTGNSPSSNNVCLWGG